MDFFENWRQPQLFTMLILVILVTIVSIIIYFKIKKSKVDEAPSATVMLVESYFLFLDDTVESSGEGYVNKAKPYFFSLFIYFVFGNLLTLFGLEPISASTSVTLSLGFVSWVGTFVVGFIYGKFRYLFSFIINPFKWIGSPGPLISISFRMYGNIIAGSVMTLMIYYGVQNIYQSFLVGTIGNFNLPVIVLLPPFLVYFDIIDSLIQSFIFVVLNISYWGMEVEEHHISKKKLAKMQATKTI
ncbi:F0F1 ATP synthase subunit A [Mesomycoplasma conjunctivae]|uniref:ATP synthase A chain n=1 Tax=Mesomycoplasma conjunctivae (strain ATCC 25834 / NCTC 10147 / HRC/581) TaxID=572263 RepID=C5J783_MESCH|nr:F0F1 ATP synthase subunit A [Mesomycoplasma conjunctivae]CAT05346.1 ATP synthase A chain [Mesomycoplasma conjunctivae]VEU66572.1 F0F1 ATP synthase subunit A [Mesomycoplasma conjunctivae]